MSGSDLSINLFFPGHLSHVLMAQRHPIEKHSQATISFLEKNVNHEDLVGISGPLNGVLKAIRMILNCYKEDVELKMPVAANQVR